MPSDRSPRKTTSPWRDDQTPWIRLTPWGTRETEDTQEAIAEDLGVSRSLVTQVANDPAVKDVTRNELNTNEKREQVREFVEDTPTA